MSELSPDSPTWILFDCVGTSDLSGIKNCLKDGADVNYIYSDGDQIYTALHLAAYNGNTTIVKELIDNGADITILGSLFDGEFLVQGTPLHMASHFGYVETMENLIQKDNIDVTDGTFDYFTALHAAVINGKINAIEFLLSKGADIEAFNGASDTAVTIASENGQLETLKFLVSKGAKLNVVSNVQTPLLAAAENGHLEVVKFLIENGLDVNGGATYRKDSALHVATLNNHLEVIKYLISKGADINQLNNEGKNFLDIASEEAKEIILNKSN